MAKEQRTCSGPDCTRPARERGFCPTHYQQWRTREDRQLTPIQAYRGNGGVKRTKLCTVPGCGRPYKARGWCTAHWVQMKRHGELREVKTYDLDNPACNIAGCGEPALAKRRCEKHLTYGYNLTRFGITLQDYVRMMDEQDGGCAICGGTNANKRALSVDHDHACCPGERSCGKCVRSLLCSNCNFATGLMRDDPVRLRAAAAYIESHRLRLVV